MTAKTPSKKNKVIGDIIIFVTLLILSIGGIGVTNFSPAMSHYYWLTMVFIFASASLFEGYKKARSNHQPFRNDIGIHLLHWTGTLFAVLATYTLLHTGRIDYEQTGLMILIILALAAFLDGIRISWRFCLTGFFLGVSVIIIAYIEEYMLIILFFALTVLFFGLFWRRKKPS